MTIRRVPTGEYPTIQDAIDASGAGDTVLVDPGTYAESVVIPAEKDRLRLVGAGSGASILTGDGKATAGVHIRASAFVTVQGFTVEGLPGTGLLVSTSDNLIRDLEVLRCRGAGAVIRTPAERNFVVESTIRENGQGGILLEGPHSAIVDCVVELNIGTGITVAGRACLLLETTVEQNAGDGVVITSGANLLIRNAAVANVGAGLVLESGGHTMLYANEAVENEGEGISVRSDANRIVDNPAGENEGGGILLLDAAAGNVVDENLMEANSGPGLLLEETTSGNVVRACSLLGNVPDIQDDGHNLIYGIDSAETDPPEFPA